MFGSWDLDNFYFLCNIFWYFAVFFCNLFYYVVKFINITVFQSKFPYIVVQWESLQTTLNLLLAFIDNKYKILFYIYDLCFLFYYGKSATKDVIFLKFLSLTII